MLVLVSSVEETLLSASCIVSSGVQVGDLVSKQINSMRYSVNRLGNAHGMCLVKNEVEKDVLILSSGAKVNHG